MTNEELSIRVKSGGGQWETLELWEVVRRFIDKKANLFYSRRGNNFRIELEDLRQAGFIAMLDAVDVFDPDKGGNFLGTLDLTLKKRFAEVAGIRSSKRDPIQYSDSTNVARFDDDPDGETLEDFIEDPRGEYAFCIVEHSDYIEYVHRLLDAAIDRLTPHQQEYIRRHYWEGQTLEQIAGEGKSRQSADIVISQGLRIVRRSRFRNELYEALQGFGDFEESRAGGYRRVEMQAISKSFARKQTEDAPVSLHSK